MFNKLRHYFQGKKFTDPYAAYQVWAPQYDHQPGNLMLALDEVILLKLLEGIDVSNKNMLDIGCGTGRHWQMLLDGSPATLTGYDISEEMLLELKKKFSSATTYRMMDNRLLETQTSSVQVILSTLTIAHIKNIKTALHEWNRVLQPGGYVLITDFHPVALQKGATRSFRNKSRQVVIRNHIHSLDKIQGIARQHGWKLQELIEEKVDERIRHFYEHKKALDAYDSFTGIPVIYGMIFKKQDAN